MKRNVKYSLFILACIGVCFSFAACLNPFLQRPALTFTVTFDSNGGEDVPSQEVISGKKAACPEEPTKQGFAFIAWFIDEDLNNEYDFNTPVTDSFTLYARWRVKSYTVKFEANGGNPAPPDQPVNYRGKVNKPPPMTNSDGDLFEDWYTEAAFVNKWDFSNDTVTRATTLYAKWKTNKYAITYLDVGGGAFTGTHGFGYPNTHTDGAATPLVSPTKTGYRFDGWFTASNGLGTALTFLPGTGYTVPITLYAKWTPDTYPITYLDVGGGAFSGTPNPPGPTMHTYGTATPLVSPTKTGYAFTAWFIDSNGAGTPLTVLAVDGYTAPITLYAKWDNNTHTVTFDAKGGTPAPATQTVTSGGWVTSPTPPPTYSYFVLDGWYREAAYATKWNFTTDTVTADITLYAKWIIMETVPISRGTFMMGTPGETGPGSRGTYHEVEFTYDFHMGIYEVTQEQYEEVTKEEYQGNQQDLLGTIIRRNPSKQNQVFPVAGVAETNDPGKLPVEQMSWYDTLDFCNRLSILEGYEPVYTLFDIQYVGNAESPTRYINTATVIVDWSKNGYRLPTEAEWEYCCRAGTTKEYAIPAIGTDSQPNGSDNADSTTGWYYPNSNDKTHQVGLRSPNAWGLYDMAGNVWEIVWDWRAATSGDWGPIGAGYPPFKVTNPVGPEINFNPENPENYKIIRGGTGKSQNGNNTVSSLRSAGREVKSANGAGHDDIGFRVVRGAIPNPYPTPHPSTWY